MRIPEKVRISGVDYKIVRESGPILIDHVQCLGCIEYEQAVIRLDADVSCYAKMKQTLLHEILHGIARDRDIELGDAEEEVIDAFAKGLYQMIADNPGMFNDGEAVNAR